MVIIELFLYLTYDFTKALLSFGQDPEVFGPLKLRKSIEKELANALKNYGGYINILECSARGNNGEECGAVR